MEPLDKLENFVGVQSCQNPDDSDQFGLRNGSWFWPPDKTESLRIFYWILSPWKVQGMHITHIVLRLKYTHVTRAVNAITRLVPVHIPHISIHYKEQFSTCRLFYNNSRLSCSILTAISIWLSILHFIWNKILPLCHFHIFTALSYYKDRTYLFAVLLPPLSCLDNVTELRSDDVRLADFPMCWLRSSSAE